MQCNHSFYLTTIIFAQKINWFSLLTASYFSFLLTPAAMMQSFVEQKSVCCQCLLLFIVLVLRNGSFSVSFLNNNLKSHVQYVAYNTCYSTQKCRLYLVRQTEIRSALFRSFCVFHLLIEDVTCTHIGRESKKFKPLVDTHRTTTC